MTAAHSSNALRVEFCCSLAECEPHMDGWARLAESAEFGEWFAGPQWVVPLLRTYFVDRLHLIGFVYDQKELVAVMPLVGSLGSGRCDSKLALPVNAHVRRIGMLCARAPRDVLLALLRAVLQSTPSMGRILGHPCVGMLQVPVDGWFDHSIRESAKLAGLTLHTVPQTRSAIIEVADGWDAYVATRTGEQLHPLRKHRKLKGKDAGHWEFLTVHGPEALPEAWAGLLHIEERSWKHETGTSIVNDPGASSFYLTIAESHAISGRLRIDLLRRNGVPVAHCLGVVYGGTYYLLKHSFDEAFRNVSPGFQLLWYTMGKRVAEGCTTLDLLGDDMPWKRALATSLPEYVSHRLFEANAISCQLCRFKGAVLKPAANRIGVKRLLAALRQTPTEESS